MTQRMQRILGGLLLVAYVLLRIVADPFFWQNISEYYSYAFELGFVACAYFLFRDRIHWRIRTSLADLYTGAWMLASGYLVFRAAAWIQVPVPFDFSSHETLFLLLIFGPLLEELVFRMALWQAAEILFSNVPITLILTTLLFSAGHFSAYWSMPDQFKGFVLYQAVYVLYLGGICGWRRARSGTPWAALIAHAGFNLGFFLATVY